jgi:hypothetical protein
MNHIIVLAKIAILVALVTIVPFKLAVTYGVPPLYAVIGSFAAAILLTSVWMGGRKA